MQIKPNLSSLCIVAGLVLSCSSASAGVARGIVTRTAPHYPELARKMHVGGTVILRVTVQPSGIVSDTKVESGHPLLVPAAQEAVSRWRYSAATDASEMTVAVNFNMDSQ